MAGPHRRSFVAMLGVALFAGPGLAAAQPARTARVGWVGTGPGPSQSSEFLDAFRRGLGDKGWIEGRNLALEVRWGNRDQARDLAVELRSRVDVIVAQGPMVYGVQAAGGSVPVVFGFSGDPVEAGLVASLARPGGNLTGLSLMSFELMGKRLELLKEAVPRAVRLAVLANPAHPGEQAELRETRAAAERLGLVVVQYLPVQSAADFEPAFDAIAHERAEAIVAFPDALIMSQARAIGAFAARRRIPAVSGWAEFAERDNLLSYGPELRTMWGQAATYVDRILRGARAADLPVERPAKIELVVNMKTARALGLTLPQSIIARADRVVE